MLPTKLKLPAALAAAAAVALSAAPAALAASSPTVTSGAVTSDAQTSAVLNGTVNPNGARTTYLFQYGTTQQLGMTSQSASAGSGTKKVSVKSPVAGLTPGTIYYYRLVASNSSGTGTGATRSFKTEGNPPPGAATGGAVHVTRSAATLTGTVYPNNEATTFYFQYGLTGAYTAQTLPLSVSGSGAAPVSSTLLGLAAGTVFHYRLVVQHSTAGTLEYGSDQFFETLPSPRPRPRVTAATTPRHARTRATITTSGHIADPRSILGLYGCAGTVRITLSEGRRIVRSERAPVQPSCTFAAATRFNRLPGRGARGRTVVLTVRVRFLGNGYLAPSSARNQTITLR